MALYHSIFRVNPEDVDEISDQLLMLGAVAITLQDATDQPLFEPQPGTTPLWDQIQLIALFESTSTQQLQQQLEQHLPSLSFKLEPVEQKDWIRASLEQFTPMLFGKNLWICPTFHTLPDPKARHVILDPGLAFGTGSHESTRLCLEWIDEHLAPGTRVIDYGCGSGILGIAALQCGAEFVTFVDHDPQALTSTHTNLEQNHCDPKRSTVVTPEQLAQTEQADVILANILAEPLIELAKRFESLLKPQGTLVLSGLLASQLDWVWEAYHQAFTQEKNHALNDWLRVIAHKN